MCVCVFQCVCVCVFQKQKRECVDLRGMAEWEKIFLKFGDYSKVKAERNDGALVFVSSRFISLIPQNCFLLLY